MDIRTTREKSEGESLYSVPTWWGDRNPEEEGGDRDLGKERGSEKEKPREEEMKTQRERNRDSETNTQRKGRGTQSTGEGDRDQEWGMESHRGVSGTQRERDRHPELEADQSTPEKENQRGETQCP